MPSSKTTEQPQCQGFESFKDGIKHYTYRMAERIRSLANRVHVKVNIQPNWTTRMETEFNRINYKPENTKFNIAPVFKYFAPPTAVEQIRLVGQQNANRPTNVRHEKTVKQRLRKEDIPRIDAKSLNPRRPMLVLKISQITVSNVLSSIFKNQSNMAPAAATVPVFCVKCDKIVNKISHNCTV